MRTIVGAELKRALNIRVLIGIAGICLCICFDSWNDLMRALESGVGDVHYFFWNSAFGGVCRTYLLPAFAVLPFSSSFCMEYKSRILPFIVSRENRRIYCTVKYVVTIFVSGLCVALATAILFGSLACKFPIAADYWQDPMINEPYHVWIAVYHPMNYFFIEVAMGALRGILWSGIALCVSAYIPDAFVTLISPYFASFIARQICRMLNIADEYQLDKMLMGSVVRVSSMNTLVICTVAVLSISCLFGILFQHRMKRRLEDEMYQ